VEPAVPVEPPDYVGERRNSTSPEAVHMGAVVAWFTAVVLTLSLVVVLHQVGVDVSPTIGSVLHGALQVLNRPLF
jgi:hypothetical protein